MHGQWDTRGLAPADAGEGVRAQLSHVHLPWTLSDCRPEPFGVRLAWQGIGEGTLVEYRGAPCAGHRRAAEIRRTDRPTAGLLLVLSGREHVRQGECAAELSAGDLFLWDGTRPIDFSVPAPLHKLTLLLPRERLVRALERAGGIPPWGRIAAGSGTGALLAAHLAALGRHAGALDAAAAEVSVGFALDLVAGLVSAPATAGAAGLRARAAALIDHHFDDSALTPTRLAARLAVTPRYLHMAFASTGGTVAETIRARRLERLRRDLADPALTGRSVTALALSAGFDDPAHASRAFRNAVGTSPSAFRAAALGRRVDAAGGDPADGEGAQLNGSGRRSATDQSIRFAAKRSRT
jgi:AraC-like DNA-binding protein